MNIGDALKAALERADEYTPSPDLFARVTRTLEEDARHRQRVRRGLLGAVLGIVALVVWLLLTGDVVDGRPTIPVWSLEVVVTAALVVLVAALGPALRRFGVTYLRDALGGDTAGQYATLLDIAYYLVAAGYVLLTAFSSAEAWATTVDAAEIRNAAWRLGGLALLLGVGHTLNLLVAPLLGLVLRSIRWRASPVDATDPRARVADRVALMVVWVVGLVCALAVASVVVVLAVFGMER